MELKTQRLRLRPWTEADLPALTAILTDPVTMQHWPKTPTAADAEAWLKRNIEHYQTYEWSRYAVELTLTGKLIGDCGILYTSVNDQLVYDLGYIIHATYWLQGYAREASSCFVDYAFNELGLPALHANMAYNHYGSQRVAESLNMTRIAEFNNPRNRNYLTYVYRLTQAEHAEFSVGTAARALV